MGRNDQRSRDRFGRVNKVYMNSNLEGTSKTDLTQCGPLYRCTLIRACQIAMGYGPEGDPRFLIDRSGLIIHGINLKAGQHTETEFVLAGGR